MPSAGTHAKFGAIAGGVTYIGMCKVYEHQPNIGELAVCVVASILAAAVPDLLEPAFTPNHRGLAHSLTTLTLISGLLAQHFCADHERAEAFKKILLACLGVGYITHLLADARTPRGLPVFC